MKTLVLASNRSNAGKTSLIVGLGRALGGKHGYLKPFGDRLRYHRKVLWDHDSALMAELFDMDEPPEDITLGFDHDKLRFMYDRKALKTKLSSMVDAAGAGKDALFIECGSSIQTGASLGLDPISITQILEAPLILVLNGGGDAILDDCALLSGHIFKGEVGLKGVILNKLEGSPEERKALVKEVEGTGLTVLGAIPRDDALTTLTVEHLSELLFARLLAGEDSLRREIRHIYVASMPPEVASKDPRFHKEGTLVITSGDRSHMILTALEAGAAALVLTNDHLPPSNIISKASDMGTPVLLVSPRTYETAKQVVEMEPILTVHDTGKMDILEKLVREHVDLKALSGL
jgi:BioD-like phosphotransacetylase family protein